MDGVRDRALELDDTDRRFMDAFALAVTEHIMDRDLDVKHLADYLAMSERTLRRRVNDVCATTPAQYIRDQRLEHARTLLRNDTYGTVAEVALAVGFAHAGHFARLYKAAHGISPKDEARLTATELDPEPETSLAPDLKMGT